MRARFLLLALLVLPLAYSAETHTIAPGQNYTVEGNTYTVTPLNENTTQLEKDGSRSLMELRECLAFDYTETCLTGVTATASTFSESYTGAIVTATHTLSSSSNDLGDEVNGTVTLRNTGEQVARNVSVTIQLPENLQFRSGNKRTFSWTGTVTDTTTVKYTFFSLKNGSYSVGGSFTYLNGSEYLQQAIDNKSLTVTAPFTLSVVYDQNATTESQLNITVKKSKTENYTIILELTLPPEVNVSSINYNTRERDNVLTHRSRENATQATINAFYSFNKPPSTNATLIIEYEREGEEEQHLTHTFPYYPQFDSEPSLAVNIDPLLENTTGKIQVTVTGNRIGQLWLRGLVDYTVETGPGVQELNVPPTTAGNHTLDVKFFSTDPYGKEHIAEGSVQIPVDKRQTQPVSSRPPPSSGALESNTTQEPPIAVETKSFPFIALFIGALCLVTVIGFTMLHTKDPLTKLDRLTTRVEKLRKEIEKRKDASASEDLVQLAALEEELEILLKKL